uniref:Uncharacterized protein n=1 Tax=Herposiphonia versicolor TaxID=2007163 RepID=A0A1Z1MFA2_9FLOR|nr:hypothetical protein [Herposiphonia versicolor]ARW64757.1 hypothetical protein [Herposiphonia versicolor]
MNFFNYISSNNYIDKNKKNNNSKHMILFYILINIYLIICPYLSLQKLQILFVILEVIVIILFKSFYIQNNLKIINQTLILYCYTILFSYFLDDKYYHSCSFKFSQLSLIYYFSIVKILYKNKVTIYINLYYICYKIIAQINKIITLNIIYILCVYKNSILIKIETSNILIFTTYMKIRRLNTKSYYVNKINILLNTHILEKIIENFNNIYLGIKIKNNISIYILIKYILIHINKYLYYLLNYKNKLNIVLYTRHIKKIMLKNIYTK